MIPSCYDESRPKADKGPRYWLQLIAALVIDGTVVTAVLTKRYHDLWDVITFIADCGVYALNLRAMVMEGGMAGWFEQETRAVWVFLDLWYVPSVFHFFPFVYVNVQIKRTRQIVSEMPTNTWECQLAGVRSLGCGYLPLSGGTLSEGAVEPTREVLELVTSWLRTPEASRAFPCILLMPMVGRERLTRVDKKGRLLEARLLTFLVKWAKTFRDNKVEDKLSPTYDWATDRNGKASPLVFRKETLGNPRVFTCRRDAGSISPTGSWYHDCATLDRTITTRYCLPWCKTHQQTQKNYQIALLACPRAVLDSLILA